MKLSMFYVCAVTFITSFALESCANSIGSMSGRVLETSLEGNAEIKGAWIAQESISLKVGDTVSGNGYLEAPYIEIVTHSFKFTGTISCTEKCTLRAATPIDITQFKMSGNGQLCIVYEPYNLFEHMNSGQGSLVTRGLFVMTTLGILGYKLYNYGSSK